MRFIMVGKRVILTIVSLGVIGIFISCLSEPEAPIVIGDIAGTVLDAETFLAIPGVTISTDPATSTVTSGSDGKFGLNDLAEGDYTLTAARTGYNSTSSAISVIADRVVNADIQLDPLASILVVNASELNFGTATSNLNLQIQNGGYGTLSWTVSKNQPWLTVTPSSGSTETETDLINVAVDRTGYNPGNYSDIISIITNSNAASISALMVVASTQSPQLTVAPDSYDYGTSESSHQFVVSNSGIGTLEWTAISNTSWLSMDVTSGSIESGTNIINVTVDRFELQAGDYSGNISVSSNGGNQMITVNATVSTASELLLSVSELDFENNYGELQVVLSNSSDVPLSWQAIPGQTWITINPTEGILETTPTVATITVNREALGIGTHSGSVDFIYAGGIATLTVQLDVTSVPLENPTLQISASSGSSVVLGWTRPSNSTSFLRYDIRRSTSPGITEEVPVLTSISEYSGNTYTDPNLLLSHTYYYRVYAVNSDGYGTPSNEVSFTTDFAAPGTWLLQANLGISGNWSNVFMVNNSTGYALVGQGGNLFEYIGSSWDFARDFDWSTNYTTMSGTNQNDIWIAGEYNTILHYDGITWTEFDDIRDSYHYYIYDISINGANDIWFGGGYYSDPIVYHYDGSTFTTYELLGGSGMIKDIEFSSANEGYALTSSGSIFYWNGTGWANHTTDEQMPGTGEYYQSMSVLGPNNIWVCRDYAWEDEAGDGVSSYIYHFDGLTWSASAVPMTGTSSGVNTGYEDIIMIDSTQGWAIGYSGSIAFTGNGLDWSLVNSPTTAHLQDLQMLDEDNGWAIGSDGTIIKYSGD